MKKFLIAGAVCAFAATSVYAQTATEYYVVRDASTKKCTIVDKKPTATTTTVVDNGTFKTKTEAETGMKSIKGLHGKISFKKRALNCDCPVAILDGGRPFLLRWADHCRRSREPSAAGR